MEKVGLKLDQHECFSHGQLYVGASRVRQDENLRILPPRRTNKVNNVVQKRMLDNEDIEDGKRAYELLCNKFTINFN